jgi:hypothetical protein
LVREHIAPVILHSTQTAHLVEPPKPHRLKPVPLFSRDAEYIVPTKFSLPTALT